MNHTKCCSLFQDCTKCHSFFQDTFLQNCKLNKKIHGAAFYLNCKLNHTKCIRGEINHTKFCSLFLKNQDQLLINMSSILMFFQKLQAQNAIHSLNYFLSKLQAQILHHSKVATLVDIKLPLIKSWENATNLCGVHYHTGQFCITILKCNSKV